MVGYAWQKGLIPIGEAAIMQAIELNGAAVESNKKAFEWGRRAAVDVASVERAATPAQSRPEGQRLSQSLEETIARRRDFLAAYQNNAYAKRYEDFVGRVRAAEQAKAPGSTQLTSMVARYLFKLMAYKDEYEVARLLLSAETRASAEAVGGAGAKVEWHLHPPLLRAMGMKRKIRLGRWATPALAVLRSGRRVRGTALDPFGHNAVRRLERDMIDEYIDAVQTLTEHYHEAGADTCVSIAMLPDRVRGYEDLKLRRAQAYRLELAECVARLGADASHR
jgi:indolepyruvate ferredoxin oxidoreductase